MISLRLLEGIRLLTDEVASHIHLQLNQLALRHLRLRLILHTANLRKPIFFLLVVKFLHLKQLLLLNFLPQILPWDLLDLIGVNIEILYVVVLPAAALGIGLL